MTPDEFATGLDKPDRTAAPETRHHMHPIKRGAAIIGLLVLAIYCGLGVLGVAMVAPAVNPKWPRVGALAQGAA